MFITVQRRKKEVLALIQVELMVSSSHLPNETMVYVPVFIPITCFHNNVLILHKVY